MTYESPLYVDVSNTIIRQAVDAEGNPVGEEEQDPAQAFTKVRAPPSSRLRTAQICGAARGVLALFSRNSFMAPISFLSDANWPHPHYGALQILPLEGQV
jgi:hypothetical protein